MGRDDLFKRTFEAGTAFLDMSRERAEALVKDLVKAGEVQKGKAQKAIDDVLERSRKGGEELRQLIRREISQQIGAMGLATHDDIRRLEARLAEMAAAPAATTGVADGPPAPAAQPAKAAGVKRATAKKAPAPGTAAGTAKVPPLKKAGPPRKKASAAPAAPATSARAPSAPGAEAAPAPGPTPDKE